MKNEDLPEIDIEKKKDKKKGFLPWLKQKLGFGNSSMGELSSGARAGANFGKGIKGLSFNLAKTGASKTGIFALLAGKGSMIAGLAVATLAVGTVFYVKSQRNASSPVPYSLGDSSSATSNKYIPAILREQSNASSLDMFMEANKGKMISEEEAQKIKEEKEKKAKEEQAALNKEENNNENDSIGVNQLQGVKQIGLSSDINGGSNKFSALGGFGNSPGSGVFGQKVGFSNSGNGFTNLPKFQDKKNKLLAMSSKKFSTKKSQALKRDKFGKAAFDQAKGIKATQTKYSGNNSDGLKSTQDLAWEGQTGAGTPTGGMGLGSGTGGGGMVETPSVINDVAGGGGGVGQNGDYSYPETTGMSIDNPWGDMLSKAMMLLLASAALAFAGSLLIKKGWPMLSNPASFAVGIALVIAGMLMAVAALMLALKVLMIGMTLKSTFGQAKLGMLYIIGGMVGIVGAIAAMFGGAYGTAATIAMWASAGAAILALFASMAMGPSMSSAANDKLNQVQTSTSSVNQTGS